MCLPAFLAFDALNLERRIKKSVAYEHNAVPKIMPVFDKGAGSIAVRTSVLVQM